MKISVGTTPQAIYPDGYQDAVTVTNTGSSDIFLDRTTAISPTESIRLVPGSYIVWDAEAPLYLLSSHAHGEAGIIINGEALGRHTDRKLALLLEGTGLFENTKFPPYGESGVILDVSPYSGIIVQVTHMESDSWTDWMLTGRNWFGAENNPSLFQFRGYADNNSTVGDIRLMQTFWLPVDSPTILLESSKQFLSYNVFGTNQLITQYAADWDSHYRYPFAPGTLLTGDFGQLTGMTNDQYMRIIKPMKNVHMRMNPATADIGNSHRIRLNRVTGYTSGEIRQYHYMKRSSDWSSNATTEVHAVFPAPRFTASSLSYSGTSFVGVTGTFQAEY